MQKSFVRWVLITIIQFTGIRFSAMPGILHNSVFTVRWSGSPLFTRKGAQIGPMTYRASTCCWSVMLHITGVIYKGKHMSPDQSAVQVTKSNIHIRRILGCLWGDPLAINELISGQLKLLILTTKIAPNFKTHWLFSRNWLIALGTIVYDLEGADSAHDLAVILEASGELPE